MTVKKSKESKSIVDVFEKVFKMHNEPYETRFKKTLLIFTLTLSIIISAIFGCIFLFGFEIEISGWISIGADWFYVIVNIFNILALTCHRSFNIMFYITVITVLIVCFTSHFGIGRGVNSGGLYFIYVFCYFVILLNVKFKYFLLLGLFILVSGVQIYDIFVPPTLSNSFVIHLLFFMGLFLSFSLIITTTIFKHLKERKNNALLRGVAGAVSSLNLSNKYVDKLKKMNDRKCTKILLIFKRIIRNIENYKSYIPPSLYDENLNEEERISHENESISSSKSSKNSKNRYSIDHSNEIIGIDTIVLQQKKELSYLRSKEITYMLIKLRHEHIEDLLNLGNDAHEMYVALHTFYMNTVTNCLKKYGGVLSGFDGFLLKITFNAIKVNMSHQTKSIKCAFNILKELRNEFKKVGDIINNKIDAIDVTLSSSFKFGFVISSSYVTCGNIGNADCKKFQIFGKCINNAMKIMTHIERLDLWNIVVCDSVIERRARYTFKTKILDMLESNQYLINFLSGMKGKVKSESLLEEKTLLLTKKDEEQNPLNIIYKIINQKKKNDKSNEEWMYKIQTNSLSNQRSQYYISWMFFLEGRFKEAQDLMGKYATRNMDDKDALILLNRIWKILNIKKMNS